MMKIFMKILSIMVEVLMIDSIVVIILPADISPEPRINGVIGLIVFLFCSEYVIPQMEKANKLVEELLKNEEDED